MNAYIVLSGERPILVDPGPYEEESVDSLLSLLRQMGVNIKKVDVFVTHFHIDHIGQAYALYGRSARIFLNRIETKLIEGDLERRWELLKKDYVVLWVSQRGNRPNGRTPSHTFSPQGSFVFHTYRRGSSPKKG